jgi:hypothetical protein
LRPFNSSPQSLQLEPLYMSALAPPG